MKEETKETIRYAIEDFKVLAVGFLKGLLSLRKRSTWAWVKETADDNDMSIRAAIGIVLFNDYRQMKHFERQGDY